MMVGLRTSLAMKQKEVVEIQKDDTEFNLLMARYSILKAEPIHRYLLEALRVQAFEHGKKTEVHRLAYFSKPTFTLYLFNLRDRVYRISPDRTETVNNGTDGVLFLSDPKCKPFEIKPGARASSPLEEVLFSRINFSSDCLTVAQRKLTFRIWFFSLFFESLMPTKIINVLIGPKGSGKSFVLRVVGMLLFGESFNVTPVPEDRRDFDAAVSNSHYLVVDNADSKCDWLPDRLATVATGGSIKRRDYYTTNKLVEFATHCFLAITSRTPHFRRDDVADRLLIHKVKRIDNFIAEAELLAEVINRRDDAMSEVVEELQRMVQALQESCGERMSFTHRMADFASLAVRVSSPDHREEVKAILDLLSKEQSSFSLENEPIFDLLLEWAKENPGREISNPNLCKELATLAEKLEVPFPYKTVSENTGQPEYQTKSFGHRMSLLRANLERFFVIEKRSAGGHKTLYKYTPKPESDEGGEV